MIRRWASLAWSLGIASTAHAESGVQLVWLSVPNEIPSDGVLPFTGRCSDSQCSNMKSLGVVDTSDGSRVEGQVELLQIQDYGSWAYFTPNQPFRSGATYAATLGGPWTGLYATRETTATAPEQLSEGAVRVDARLTKEREVTQWQCCGSSCLEVSVVHRAVLSVYLSADRPVASQHLFELSLYPQGEAAARTAVPFRPLPTGSSNGASEPFDGAADSYCYTLRARPIVGGEPIVLKTDCVANELEGFGTQVRSPEEVAQWAAKCETTPTRVDAGAPPRNEADAAVDADGERLGRGDGSTFGGEDSGCQLASGSTHTSGLAWSLLALLALVVRRRGSFAGWR